VSTTAIVGRAELLAQLEAVRPGLSTKEYIAQSSCFAFTSGWVMTFNDDTSCRAPTGLAADFRFAVKADPVTELLRKMSEDRIQVELDGPAFVVRGKGGKDCTFPVENDILLPVEKVDKPGEWVALPGDFAEAVDLVKETASKDESQFSVTCIHIAPDRMESADRWQISRYRLKTGVQESTYVRADSIRHIVQLGMTRMSVTKNWVHFRNPERLIHSCRRYLEDVEFPNVGQWLKMTNPAKFVLPPGLTDAVEKADIFSKENGDQNQVLVEISDHKGGRLRVTGQGTYGKYREPKKIRYSGPDFKFLISPKILIQIAKTYTECKIDGRKLLIDGGEKFVYATSLGQGDESSAMNGGTEHDEESGDE
jgi:hypothetical protein